MSESNAKESGSSMTIGKIMLFSLFVALAIGMGFSENGQSGVWLMSISQWVIATSLAAPFLCAPSARPFWVGYAVTTTYATLLSMSEFNAIVFLVAEPIAWVMSQIAPDDERLGSWSYANALIVWTAPMLGLLSGCALHLLCRSKWRHKPEPK